MTPKVSKRLYKLIMEHMPILCVDLLIKNGNQFLLVLRKNKPLKDSWWLPGGRVYKGESLEDAVRRKAKEECGLSILNLKEVGTYTFMSNESIFDDLRSGLHTVSVVFIITTKNLNVKIDLDHKAYQWFKYNEFPEDLKISLKKLNIK